MAGARTVIMGLWSVDDDVAREWMEELYRQRFVQHRTTAQAVRAAGQRLLDERRATGRSAHPSTWGAFTAAGEWH
jgi:CHAT domain-containing protein